jgi:hypothetical protein
MRLAPYGWDDIAMVIGLTGDGHGHHIPGTPYTYRHGFIPVDGTGGGQVKVFGQHSPVTPKQEAAIREGIAAQAKVSAGVVASVSSVSTSKIIEQSRMGHSSGLSGYNRKTGKTWIQLSSRLFSKNRGKELDAVLAHEVGHASANAAFGPDATPKDPAYWRDLAHALGISAVPEPNREAADKWLTRPDVRAALRKLGMPYETDNISEFNADMWADFAAGSPRPPARVYGEAVKRAVDSITTGKQPS